jgi:hypothetical protein
MEKLESIESRDTKNPMFEYGGPKRGSVQANQVYFRQKSRLRENSIDSEFQKHGSKGGADTRDNTMINMA